MPSDSVQTEVDSLIKGLQGVDPRLYQAISLLNDQLDAVNRELHPLVQQSTGVGGGVSTIDAPATFSAFTTSTTVRLIWSLVIGAAAYEIRVGTVWETASFQLRTGGLQADIDPLLIGTYSFLIKSIDTGGNYSVGFAQTSLTISSLGTFAVTGQVIDNNVLLSWTVPTSQFNIKHYEVYKDSTLLGTLNSTFFVRFEAIAGIYAYKVIAVDIAGNRSPDALVTLQVSAPPDYVLQDLFTSQFLGTRVNVIREDTPSLLCCHAPESFEDHFVSRLWNSPQDQIDAGYPIYIQPTAPNGSYTEIIDYGAVLSGIIVTTTFQKEVIVPDVNIVVQMRVSNDGSSYSAATFGASQFFPQLRYLELKLAFTATT